MSHSGSHEQAVKTLDVAAAAEERHHALVVVATVLRGDQLVAPAVVLEQLAAALPELPEIWIGGVEDRSKLRFSLDEGLVASRIGEVECPPVPVRIGEHEPFIMCDRNRERIGGVEVGPERLAS